MKKPSISFRALPALLAGACAGFSLAALAQVAPTDPNVMPGTGPGSGPSTSANTSPSTSPSSTQGVSGPGIGIGAGPSTREVVPMRTAQASSSSTSNAYARDDGYSLLPYTRRGYWGVNLGRADFKDGCGNGAYGCDNPDLGFSVYTGGLFNDWFGMELGYMYTGKADRAGGDTQAQGVNLSLVARAPIGGFNLFAKGGAIYAQTEVSTGVLSDVPSGKRRDWGGIYGVGVGFDFTPSSGVVLEWSRSELRFAGVGGRENVDMTSLGYVRRF